MKLEKILRKLVLKKLTEFGSYKEKVDTVLVLPCEGMAVKINN